MNSYHRQQCRVMQLPLGGEQCSVTRDYNDTWQREKLWHTSKLDKGLMSCGMIVRSCCRYHCLQCTLEHGKLSSRLSALCHISLHVYSSVTQINIIYPTHFIPNLHIKNTYAGTSCDEELISSLNKAQG